MTPGQIVLIVVLCLLLAAIAALGVLAVLRTKKVGTAEGVRLAPAAASELLSNHAAESLSHVLHFRTISRRPWEEGDAGQFEVLRRYLELRYPHVHETMSHEVVADYALVYRWRAPHPSQGPVLLCAHQDVVPAGKGWSHPPFDGEMDGGFVYGRGALDCKGTLIAMMESAEALCSVGFAPSRDIWFAFGFDEELGGAEGAAKVAALFKEKGVRFDMVLDEGGSVRKDFLGFTQPIALVNVTEKGCMNLRLTAKGQPGHASTPPAATALGVMSEAICRLERRRCPAAIEPTTSYFLKKTAPMLPQWDKLLVANLPYTRPLLFWDMGRVPEKNALIRTTMAVTMCSGGTAANVLPSEATAVVNCRVRHGQTCDEVLTYVRELLHDLDIKVEVLLKKEPSKVASIRCEAYDALTRAIHDVFGTVPVVPAEMSASSDGYHYESVGENVYRFIPFVLDEEEAARIHGPEERVPVEAMGRAVLFYTQLVRELAGN